MQAFVDANKFKIHRDRGEDLFVMSTNATIAKAETEGGVAFDAPAFSTVFDVHLFIFTDDLRAVNTSEVHSRSAISKTSTSSLLTERRRCVIILSLVVRFH